jgi:hypothetical protein
MSIVHEIAAGYLGNGGTAKGVRTITKTNNLYIGGTGRTISLSPKVNGSVISTGTNITYTNRGAGNTNTLTLSQDGSAKGNLVLFNIYKDIVNPGGSGTRSVTFTIRGGRGQAVSGGPGNGGLIGGTYTMSTADTIYFIAAQSGASGGYPGADTSGTNYQAGNSKGGGYSLVWLAGNTDPEDTSNKATTLLCAGGGGGDSGGGNGGGAGGLFDGSPGDSNGCQRNAGGGTQTAGGVEGIDTGGSTEGATAGGSFSGGRGGNCAQGGAGGAGWFGGGGGMAHCGQCGGGGGGGSSYYDSTKITNMTNTTGENAGDGTVIINVSAS